MQTIIFEEETIDFGAGLGFTMNITIDACEVDSPIVHNAPDGQQEYEVWVTVHGDHPDYLDTEVSFPGPGQTFSTDVDNPPMDEELEELLRDEATTTANSLTKGRLEDARYHRPW